MNKKGQLGLYGIMSLIVFGIIWVTGLSPMINDIGQSVINSGHVTGLDAAFFSNLNLLIGILYLAAWYFVIKYY